MQAPGKRKEAKRRVGGPADAVAAGSRAGAADAMQDEGAAKRARGAHADKLEQDTEYEDKDKSVKYVPRGREADCDGAAVR